MRLEIDEFLGRRGFAASREQLLQVVTRNQLDHETAAGHLVAPFPRVYCRPWDVEDREVRNRAALLSVGGPVVLSHLTALRRWGLPTPDTDDVHVTVPIRRHPDGRLPGDGAPGLIDHRTRIRSIARRIGGLPTIDPACAVVQAWPLLQGVDERAPAIAAVRDRITTPSALHAATERAVGMPGRSRLLRLADLLAAGCESELEIWGYLDVFNAPGLDHGVRQKILRIGAATYRLDLGYEAERVAVEMDGERFHSSREQRERDQRRDATLATAGWLTLRFSHERLHSDVAGCRRDTLRTLHARRGRIAA